MKALLLVILVSFLSACGDDKCDPTGIFGCQQYTSHVTVKVENTLDEDLAVDFDDCVCCSKGDAKWTVAANQTINKEITVVDEGGGDGCDESAGLTNLTITSSMGWSRVSYDLQDVMVSCNETGCKFGTLGFEEWQ